MFIMLSPEMPLDDPIHLQENLEQSIIIYKL